MLRFKVGDLAVVVADPNGKLNGELVQILERGPNMYPIRLASGLVVYREYNYRVDGRGNPFWLCHDFELKPYEPPKSLLEELIEMERLVQ